MPVGSRRGEGDERDRLSATRLRDRLSQRIAGQAINEPEGKRLLSRKPGGANEQFDGRGTAYQAPKPLRPTPAGHQTQARAPMSEYGARGGDAASTRKREVESSAHAVTLDGGIHGGGKALHLLHKILPLSRKFICLNGSELLNLAQIGSCRKEFLIAGDDERPGRASQLPHKIE